MNISKINELAVRVSKCREAEILSIQRCLPETFRANMALARMLAEYELNKEISSDSNQK